MITANELAKSMKDVTRRFNYMQNVYPHKNVHIKLKKIFFVGTWNLEKEEKIAVKMHYVGVELQDKMIIGLLNNKTFIKLK